MSHSIVQYWRHISWEAMVLPLRKKIYYGMKPLIDNPLSFTDDGERNLDKPFAAAFWRPSTWTAVRGKTSFAEDEGWTKLKNSEVMISPNPGSWGNTRHIIQVDLILDHRGVGRDLGALYAVTSTRILTSQVWREKRPVTMKTMALRFVSYPSRHHQCTHPVKPLADETELIVPRDFEASMSLTPSLT